MSARDFDFLLGSWRVIHRRRLKRLCRCEEWETAEATNVVEPAFLGGGNIDCFRRELFGVPYEGRSIRIFDETSGLWKIYWIDTYGREVEPPLTGRFQGGVGDFYGKTQCDGREIDVRFRWTDTGTDRPKWEQAYSPDGGESWEVNSIMEFQRS